MNKERLSRLITQYQKNLEFYRNAREFNEQDCRDEFISPLLESFGWDVHNEKGTSPQYKEVVVEKFSNSGDRPDYTLTLNGVSKIFVEAKKPAVNIKEESEPAIQARRYGWNAKHKLSILTNFEDMMIYDVTNKPQDGDAATVSLYRKYHYLEYLKKYEEIYELISRESVYTGKYDEYVEEKFPSEDRYSTEVDEVFLKQINEWRLEIGDYLYHMDSTYRDLVKQLNEYRHAYYNQDAPLVSDAEYDRLFDELKELEEQTGFILSNSPTQTVGYYPVSELAKVTHPIPLLSLEKTKLISELLDFMKGQEVLFMLKLDGLTTKLIYEDGRLIQASTRGDGEVGEDITHNIPAFLNVPLTIPHKERLVITGESFIPTNDFERLKDTLRDGNGKPYKNGRNFASGSVRSLDPKNCIGRCVRFLPFNVLEGMEDVPFPDSRACKLEGLTHLGFGYCPFFSISGTGLSKEYAEKFIQELVSTAANLHLPIDGIVMIFDSLSYSKSCGKTGHHYKDGLAYKFEDDTYETFLREIEWTPTRFGEIAPVGIFDTVEIDGCDVSRASLHNLTFIKNLELVPGCRILVSKRNMIIPHIEDNLDRGRYTDITPPVCPCCGSKTRTYSRKTSDGRTVETLHCDNPQCDSQITRRFVHFASKKAMNIEGLSEATLEKFLNLGYLHSFQDIYHLEEHREDIVALDGYGEKSFDRLWESINASRRTSFVRYLVSMDIPMIGRTKSRILDTVFSGNLTAFEQAAVGDYDFTQLEDFGEILNHNIHSWFADEANLDLWKNLQNEFTFEQRKEETIMTKENKFTGCTIVATGKLEHFTRDGINDKILELGAKPGSSVTKKTDYLICGEKAGSKLAKAQSLGIPILTEAEFLEMIA